MRKFVLIPLLAAGVFQLKAQQIVPSKPADSLLNYKNFLTKPGSLNQLYNLNKPNVANMNKRLVVSTIDHMPVAVLSGYSKMPVAKLGGYYTMPVKKIGSEDVPGDLNSFPMPSALKTP